MDIFKNQVLTGKSIRSLQNNQYTFDVNPEITKVEMKSWVEKFFNVKVRSINSLCLPSKNKKQRASNRLRFSGYTRRKRMIVTLQDNYSIPLFFNQ
uniref:Large ribosomal subunit protein uL23c n=1 Tax=Azolla nilotica TaxID=336974 RepID=A0A291R7E8_9MONI|nr:ribosomal protein L23 [Azolla nilotica]